ncbi:hypothetical protein EIN_079790 [Entamoeba invadens IP1]|uniref:hypothetical protein n=1 Tax=Entamoeba invadens IP1 TaxID=370355 RepID=UPI0002C3E478|nr:hypothetical protein EIN_079790 [Entamoeba invadens IP1]ELP85037.1 hypothetical protein EIN_079790 [Entamoeba invadens IP1]|eukprot:XP_004184383.1 hypothetical protein EIN_079790 [Entamoeba invadens IP1]
MSNNTFKLSQNEPAESLELLMKLVREKAERKDGEIGKLEKDARRDVIEGFQAMETLIQQVVQIRKEADEEKKQELEILKAENLVLQKKVEVSKKEIEVLKAESSQSVVEKKRTSELYESRIGQLQQELVSKDTELGIISNELTIQNGSEGPIDDDIVTKIQEKRKQLEVEELRLKIEALKTEVDNLKAQAETNAQTNDVMWVTIMKGRVENNALKTQLDELEKGPLPDTEDIFEGFVQRGEFDKIREWTKISNYKKVGTIEGDGDENSWKMASGKSNILCIKVTQIGSVFGYFHRGPHPSLKTWRIPQTSETVFTLRNLFNKPPLIIKQLVNGKLEESKPVDLERNTSEKLEINILGIICGQEREKKGKPYAHTKLENQQRLVMYNPYDVENGKLKGNAPVEFMSTTLPKIPSDRQQLLDIGLPFAVNVHPTNPTIPVAQVNTTNGVINRCEYCRAFINPFVNWQVPGTRFVCNFCNHVNYLSKSPYQLYNETQYPELTQGCVDFVVPDNFMPRIYEGVHMVILIDLNCPALEFVIQCLDALDFTAKVALIAYDDTIHLFKASKNGVVENVIMPSMEVDICESPSVFLNAQKVKQILPLIKSMGPNGNNCLYEAIGIGSTLLSKVGGKIVVINSTPVNVGKGVYTVRTPYSEQRSNDAFKKIAADLNNKGITVDLHIITGQLIDLPQIVDLVGKTGGDSSYCGVNTLGDGTFFKALHKSICDVCGVDGSFRMRVSNTLRVVNRYGHFLTKISDVISCPVASSTTSLNVRITIDSPILAPHVYLQASYLFTNLEGKRLIRVCTIAVPVTQIQSECLPQDYGNVAGVMALILMDQRPVLKKEDLMVSLANQLAKFFKFVQNKGNTQQLYSVNVPALAVSLTLYATGIVSLISLPSSDYIVNLREQVLAMKLESIKNMILPSLFDPITLKQIPTDTNALNNLVLAYDGENWILSIGSLVPAQDVQQIIGDQSVVVVQHSEGMFKKIRELTGNSPIIVCKQGTDVANLHLNTHLFSPQQFAEFLTLIDSKVPK